MQSNDPIQRGRANQSTVSDEVKQQRGGGNGMQESQSNSPKARTHTPSGSPTSAKQSSESKKRSSGQHSSTQKSPKTSRESSPHSSPSARKTASPRSSKNANASPRESPSSSLEAASTQQGSPTGAKSGGGGGNPRSPSVRGLRKGGEGDESDESLTLKGSATAKDSSEVDASLSGSSSTSSFEAGEEDSSLTATARRAPELQDEQNLSGDLSLSSSSQPKSLSATLSRGTFHQCGTARRVKVYELKGETWFDRGTGYCAGVYDEEHDAALLVARIEEGCRRLAVEPEGGEEGEGIDEQGTPTETSTGDGLAGTEGKEDREHFMLVVSDKLGAEDLLLKTRVVKEDVYQRQQDTLVVWTEPDGTDMALSFQEADGCHEVWEFLTEVQKHFILNARQASEGLGADDGEGEGMTSGALGISSAGMASDGELVMSDGSAFALPTPSMDSIEVIDITLKDAASRSPQAREKVAEWILRDDYLLKLLPVFHDAEDLEQLEELHRLCNIMHTILMLNDSVLVERILRDDVFLGAIGMLEYDPEFPRLKASYRDYLINTTRFRQVVDIHDASILAKIHQTFRLQYLKDVVLARILDDSTFAVLNSIIFYHQADIVTFCTSSEIFLNSLFQIFEKSKGESEEKKAEAIVFLQQLCAMGKQIQLPSRIALYRTLTEWGLLIVLEYALMRTESRLRNAAAEVLMTIIEYDASGVRLHVLDQVDKNATPLITKLSHILHEGHGDLGLKTQITESLRILFDSGPDGSSGGPSVTQTLAAAAAAAAASDGGRGQKDDTDRFLNWFYDGEVDHLFSPLRNLTTFKELNQQVALSNSRRATVIDITSPAKSALFHHLCDLLTFIMIHHHFRSQYWVISSDISIRVASLLFAREKHLRLTALRFFRACLAKGNQFINRHFLKIELLSAVLAVVEGEASRDNLVTSACLDFFEHIRKENMRALIAHLMERHEARVRALTNNHSIGHYFQALLLQWEKNSEPVPTSFSEGESSLASVHQAEKERRQRDLARRGENRGIMDMDEENYFNDDDDEGSAASTDPSTVGPALGLVSYPADEEGDLDESPATRAEGDRLQEGGGRGKRMGKAADNDDEAGQSTSLELPSKRKKREAENDEDDDMMGRLAKRKTTAANVTDDEAGGFVREDNSATSRAGGGAGASSKRLSINLTSDSEKMAKEDYKEREDE